MLRIMTEITILLAIFLSYGKKIVEKYDRNKNINTKKVQKNLSFKYLKWIKIENMNRNRNQNNMDTDILRLHHFKKVLLKLFAIY